MPRNEVRRRGGRGLRALSALGALLLAVVLACTPPADDGAGQDALPAETASPASVSTRTLDPTPTASPTTTPVPATPPVPTQATTTTPASTTTTPAPTSPATPTRTPTATATPTPAATRVATATAIPTAAATATTVTLSLDGIAVAPERCDGYDRDHFASYNARALRDRWDADDGAADGVITGWYTGLRLANSGQAVHVEHVVALKEAWCSGYRAPPLGNWPTNLRPAQAALNISKSARDPAEWDRPDLPGWCRYLALHVQVKRELGMTADRAELDYIARSWAAGCGDAVDTPAAGQTPAPTATPVPTAGAAYSGPQPARTCGAFGWRVDRRTHPNLYAALSALGMRDGNSDGIMCNAERAYSGPDYPATPAPAPTATPVPTAEAAYSGPQPARTCGAFGWRVDRRTHPNLYAALSALGMRDGNSDGIMCNAERRTAAPTTPRREPRPGESATARRRSGDGASLPQASDLRVVDAVLV